MLLVIQYVPTGIRHRISKPGTIRPPKVIDTYSCEYHALNHWIIITLHACLASSKSLPVLLWNSRFPSRGCPMKPEGLGTRLVIAFSTPQTEKQWTRHRRYKVESFGSPLLSGAAYSYSGRTYVEVPAKGTVWMFAMVSSKHGQVEQTLHE